MEQTEELLVKVVLVGSTMVSKTCIFERISKDKFNSEYKSTIAVEFSSFRSADDRYRYQLWDNSSTTKYKGATTAIFRRTSIIALVFDLSNKSTFDSLETVFWPVLKAHAPESAELLVIGNKSDLTREVRVEEAEGWALSHNAFYLEISAKDSLKETIVSKLEEITNKIFR